MPFSNSCAAERRLEKTAAPRYTALARVKLRDVKVFFFFHVPFAFRENVFYIQVVPLFAVQPLVFVLAGGVGKSLEVLRAIWLKQTHMEGRHPCVFVSSCLGARVHSVYSGLAGGSGAAAAALLSQPITFTSTPNLS